MKGKSLLVVGFLLAAGCSGNDGERRMIVASIYPLAYAAQEIAGPDWEVIDLTPPGVEAHDLELTIEDRSAIGDADIVLYLGDLGFQPQVEDSVGEASGTVVDVTDGMDLLEGHADEHAEEEEETDHEGEAAFDPHFWLDPIRFGEAADRIDDALGEIDPDGADGYEDRITALLQNLEALDQSYVDGLESCETATMVVSHEAFGYPADRYGLVQTGLAGLEPEGEPTTAALAEAVELLRSGNAEAVFYEASEEARRIAEAVASDAGVSALPLNTLESQPAQGDYLTVMEDNLESLREGLGCL